MSTSLAIPQAGEINRDHFALMGKGAEMLERMADLGEKLTAVKSSLPYGEWEKWIKENLQFSSRTCRRYIEAHDRRGEVLTAGDPVALLNKINGNNRSDVATSEPRKPSTKSNGSCSLAENLEKPDPRETEVYPADDDFSEIDRDDWYSELVSVPDVDVALQNLYSALIVEGCSQQWPEAIRAVQRWLDEHHLGELELAEMEPTSSKLPNWAFVG